MQSISIEYVIPFILIIIGSIWQFFEYRKLNFLWYTIIIYIIFLSGLRDKVGPDWPGYEDVFYMLRDDIHTVRFFVEVYGIESGFSIMNLIVAKLGLGMWVFNTLFVGISVYLKSKFISEYSIYRFIGLGLYFIPYFFLEDIIQIRQGFAIAIILSSFRYVQSREFYKFLFVVFLATYFHVSAFVGILMYFLYDLKIPKGFMIVMLIISFVMSQFNILGSLLPALKAGASFSSSLAKGVSYIKEDAENLGFSYADVTRTLFVIFLIIFKDYLTERDKLFNAFINYMFIGVFLFYSLKPVPIYSSRLTGYFISFTYIVFPRLLYYFRVNILYFTGAYLGLFIYLLLMYWRFVDIHHKTFEEYTNVLYNESKFHRYD